jgi:hypothetical protein
VKRYSLGGGGASGMPETERKKRADDFVPDPAEVKKKQIIREKR